MRSNKPFGPLTGLAIAIAAVIGTGCGDLTIRTWVKVIQAESSGNVVLADTEFPLERVQGGFYGNVRVSTRDLLNALEGTITLEDVRIATANPTLAGIVCVWGNPAVPSTGDVSIDILSAEGSASIVANLKAQTRLSRQINLPPIELSQALDFELGGGIGIPASSRRRRTSSATRRSSARRPSSSSTSRSRTKGRRRCSTRTSSRSVRSTSTSRAAISSGASTPRARSCSTTTSTTRRLRS
jgi:hypothetical protein